MNFSLVIAFSRLTPNRKISRVFLASAGFVCWLQYLA
jgi:hypothetical protein